MRNNIAAKLRMMLASSIMYIAMSGFNMESLIFALISSAITTYILILHKIMIKISITKGGILYTINLFLSIIKSAIYMTKTIWTHRKISPTIQWIESNNESDPLSISLEANSITMTPGTIVVAILESRMLVHGIDKISIDALSNSDNPQNIY